MRVVVVGGGIAGMEALPALFEPAQKITGRFLSPLLFENHGYRGTPAGIPIDVRVPWPTVAARTADPKPRALA